MRRVGRGRKKGGSFERCRLVENGLFRVDGYLMSLTLSRILTKLSTTDLGAS